MDGELTISEEEKTFIKGAMQGVWNTWLALGWDARKLLIVGLITETEKMVDKLEEVGET